MTTPSITLWPDGAHSRRAFLGGATAAGISAIVAAHVPQALAASSTAPSPASALKLVSVIRRRRDLSAAQFNDYWLNHHAPLATQAIKDLGGYRYVQTHTEDSALTTLFRTSRGQVGPPYDGVTEVWFPSQDALVKAMSTPAGTEANLRLERDEPNFIDVVNSNYFFAAEYTFLGDATPPAPEDRSVAATIASTRFARSGARRMDVQLAVDETVSARALLVRGDHVLGYAHAASIKPGSRRLRLAIDKAVPAGSAELEVVFTDAAGNTKLARRHVRIPR